jgi:hypothetical protein
MKRALWRAALFRFFPAVLTSAAAPFLAWNAAAADLPTQQPTEALLITPPDLDGWRLLSHQDLEEKTAPAIAQPSCSGYVRNLVHTASS